VREYKFNTNNNFIEGYYLSDLSICDDLIKLFENSNHKVLGKSGKGTVNKKVKDSLDLQLFINDVVKFPILDKYFRQLSQTINLYKKKYKFCNEHVADWGIQHDFNIQKYKPSQAYHSWHCEHANIPSSKRHLVFMTYLNDVKQGGETEWYYQKLKVKPEKGLTVIWSADWTFTHKGHTTIDEDKYIITGWFEFKK
jgi:prolyl 4-hydroxylase